MKSSPFFNLTICIPFILVCLITVSSSHAEDFHTNASFSVNDTSTVAPRDNQDITLFDEFWGVDWDTSWARGNYALADGDPDTNAYNDYRFSIATSGRIGLNASASFNYGTMDINAPLDINMHTSQEGNVTSINADYSIQPGAGFSTSGTTGNINVSFINSLYFRYVAKVAVLGDYTTWDGTYSYLGITPIIDQDQDDPPFHQDVLGGVMSVEAQIPNVTAAGTVTQASDLSGDISTAERTASSSGSDSILDISADVGQAILYTTGIPLSTELDLFNDTTNIGFDFDATLFGGALGTKAELSQDFSVTMNPGIHLDFDRPVMVQNEMGNWTAHTYLDTALGDTVNISSSDIAHATTTYTMNWRVSNNTDIDIDAYLHLIAGDLYAKLGWGVDSATFDPDPLYEDTFRTQLAAISLYNEDWTVHGQDIAGESFSLYSIPNLGGMLSDFSDNTSPDNMAMRDALGTTIIKRNSTPTGDETPDLFTENPDLFRFLAGYTDSDSTNVDVLDGGARWDLYNLLAGYDDSSDEEDFDPDNSVFAGYFDFLLDDSLDLGIDFQPIFDDSDGDGDSTNDPVIGLFANFYGLEFTDDDCPADATFCTTEPQFVTLLSDLGLDQLFGTSFAFFYNNLADITDLTVYQNSGDDWGTFTYAYSALEQYADPVPEPATILLLGSGLWGLAWYRRKQKKL